MINYDIKKFLYSNILYSYLMPNDLYKLIFGSKLIKRNVSNFINKIHSSGYDKIWNKYINKLSIFIKYKKFIPSKIRKHILNNSFSNNDFLDISLRIKKNKFILNDNKDSFFIQVWSKENKKNPNNWIILNDINKSTKIKIVNILYRDKYLFKNYFDDIL